MTAPEEAIQEGEGTAGGGLVVVALAAGALVVSSAEVAVRKA